MKGPEPGPCVRSAVNLIILTARVSSLAFCGNLGPVSAQSQDDLMNVVRSWKGTLWKSATEIELERLKISWESGVRSRAF
jgi:hypothetical protein